MMSSCVLQDAFGGAFVNIDMITGDGFANAAFASWDGTTLSVFNAAVNTLNLKVTPTDYPEPSGTPVTFTVVDDGNSYPNVALKGQMTDWANVAMNSAPPPAADPNFSVTLTATGDGSDYDMTFGFSPNATDGYDDGIDSYAPPAPPPPAFDAALTWGGDRYYTQILNGSIDDLVEHVYDISLAYSSDNLITITWDNTGWSDMMSSCVLQDAFGGLLGIDINMLSETSLTLDNPAFNTLKLKVTPTDYAEPSTYPVTFPDSSGVISTTEFTLNVGTTATGANTGTPFATSLANVKVIF